jgi:hypothetical protein
MSKNELPNEPHPKQVALPNTIPELELAKKKLEIALKALEFYSNRHNWNNKIAFMSGIPMTFAAEMDSCKETKALKALAEINAIGLQC